MPEAPAARGPPSVKRAFLLAAVLAAPLYLRQRQVEREQREWRGEVERILREVAEGTRDWTRDSNRHFERFVKEVNRELSRAARR
jgi:predicted secreted protein